jgi:hypothetical protein
MAPLIERLEVIPGTMAGLEGRSASSRHLTVDSGCRAQRIDELPFGPSSTHHRLNTKER